MCDIRIITCVYESLSQWLVDFNCPHSAEYRNNFVRVQVISETPGINCTFLNVLRGTPTSCNATITYGETCQNQELIIGMAESDSVVIVSLRSFLEMTASSKYCGFRVNATASTRRLTVEGNLLSKLICMHHGKKNNNYMY